MTIHSFTIPGKPTAKGRPRFAGRRCYNPKSTTEYEQRVRDCAALAKVPFIRSGPISMTIIVWLTWPKGEHRVRRPRPEAWHPRKPDLDNYIKIIMDALNGVAYADDGQVAKVYAQKRYRPQGGEPEVQVSYGKLSE